jgi:CRP/FNR family transcriptional regulator
MKEKGREQTDCVDEFLRTIPVFLNVGDDVLCEVRKRLCKKQVPKGRTIYQRGDSVDALYFVEAGRVEIYKTDDEVRRLTLWYVNPGEVFCVPTVMTGTAIASAEAVEPTMLFYLDRKDFEELLGRFPELAMRFLKCVSGRIKGYADSVHAVAFSDTPGRVAEVLLKYGAGDGNGGAVCTLSRNEIASLAGTCRETVSRALGMLKRQGLIALDGRTIVIRAVDGLRKRAADKV